MRYEEVKSREGRGLRGGEGRSVEGRPGSGGERSRGR